ncbi:hypothetical protein GC096_04080 [Paenibacillus sp. LMG 31461]|uniref:Uncharacterized protein n=1 Tax=Paenibacillus plantarum TaxID=2654975 RepID=A0ABX1X489_9BACL|nr:hypothetical protein [Paenibacillus plantarum]NOU63225.1 hypothetical protein [Paenibacillus plantarum]
MKQAKEQLSLLRQSIRDEQDGLGQKYMMWKEVGVIGEFVSNKTYEYNHSALNMLLFDLGILPVVSMIDCNKLSSAEIQILEGVQEPSLSYVRFSPAQRGTQTMYSSLSNEIQELSLDEKVVLWKRTYLAFSKLHDEWDKKRKFATKCHWLQTSFEFEFGTLTKHELPMSIRTTKAFRLLNSDRILQCAKVDYSLVANYLVKGILTKSELNNCRKITEVQRKYILKTFEKENNRQIYLQQKSITLGRV